MKEFTMRVHYAPEELHAAASETLGLHQVPFLTMLGGRSKRSR